jgi:uncharacterized protein
MKVYAMKPSNNAVFRLFLLLTTLHMLWVTWGFLSEGVAAATSLSWIFHLSAWGFYAFLYSLIVVLPAWLASLFLRAYPRLLAALAIVLSSAGLMFIKSDLMIYDLYRFHFNGFIWNLMTTKGGLASLGTSGGTYVSIAGSVLLVAMIQTIFWIISVRHPQFKLARISAIVIWILAPILFVIQGLIYGISDVKNIGAVLDTAEVYPFYQHVLIRSLAARYGMDIERRHDHRLSVDTARLHYPLQAINYQSVNHPPNIVIFAAESLRWDRLTPEIMPNSWQLGQQGSLFTQHYSSGNGTREGLFGMFYGLYGSYWASFLHAQQSPLLMDRLQSLGYQFDLRTSAKFSYPEFNKTLFAKFSLADLHEADESMSPWQRDEWNASQQIAFLKQRDRSKPFMSFFFFESTHARYDFPDQAVVASPYLGDVNYWGMSRASLQPRIGEFKNRYSNAAHWIDMQIGRVLEELRTQGLLENTIIIITGDHGEEFLEKGNWGHNSTFVEEQTHVPMVVWMPGRTHAEIEHVSSHLDISPTLLQALGAPADASSYSLGRNIYETQQRDFIVVSDWRTIGVLTNDMKYRIAYQQNGIKHYVPTGRNDEVLDAEQQAALTAEHQPQLLQAIKNCSRFMASFKD